MPVITMYRDGEVAQVNSDHAETYDNFLAHGWKEEAPEADAAPTVADETPTRPAPARKAK